MLRMVWLVVAHDQVEYRDMDGLMGNLFSFLCSTWMQFWKCLKYFFGLSKWRPQKRLAGAVYR